jgi:hypothetical protein
MQAGGMSSQRGMCDQAIRDKTKGLSQFVIRDSGEDFKEGLQYMMGKGLYLRGYLI